jgi:acetolactate synthase-1/2/3 large subunit
MRVADYIFKTLAETYHVEHVFMVVGGGAMHLNDALRKERRITAICNHHEQACAIAAEGYVRASGKMGVVSVTTGPGGTNTMTGVLGQWTDSIPVLYLSGQVKYETTVLSCPEIRLRQLGDQEVNIVELVKPITKYAKTVMDPMAIREELEKAIHIAHTGRKGPVWLDIPLNVQGALIDENELRPFVSQGDQVVCPVDEQMEQVLAMLKCAERPVIIAGFGIRLSGAEQIFLRLVDRLGIPVVTTFNGFDLLSTDHPFYIGRIGTLGTRAGNFALQNADLILSFGSRNNIRQVSYDWGNFGRNAKKIVVDVDAAELKKSTLVPDLAVHSDAGAFITKLDKVLGGSVMPDRSGWMAWCAERKRRFPTVQEEQKNRIGSVDPYYFMEVLTQCALADSVTVAGNGTACVALFQSGTVKPGQRLFWNSGCASMGYDLPAAIGACIGSGKKTICLAGDGSIQMNLQELQTVIHHRLPLKIFLLDNYGYSSIRQTQKSFFKDELLGCDAESGVSFPDFIKLGEAYGFRTFEITDHDQMQIGIETVLDGNDPVFCRVKLPVDHIFSPKLSSRRLPDGRMVSSPLEDMFPFLDGEVLKENCEFIKEANG